MFTLTLHTDGAAFTDEDTGAADLAPEVARILRELSNRLDAYGMGTDGTLMDAYGNVVGEWAWRP